MQKQCEEWVSFSVFKARTLVAGICAKVGDEYDFKHPRVDIPIGLGLEGEVGVSGDIALTKLLQDCKLMVSAQFILIAGEAIKADIDADPCKGWDDEAWKIWASKFLEATTWDNVQKKTKVASKEAHDKMVKLWPDLFVNKGKTTTLEP